MKISKKLIITICIAIAIISCYALTFTALSAPAESNSSESESAPQSNVIYKVAEFEGKIAIFIEGNAQPVEILSAPFIRDLPEYDQRLLKEGIIANSNQELLRILEDYDA